MAKTEEFRGVLNGKHRNFENLPFWLPRNSHFMPWGISCSYWIKSYPNRFFRNWKIIPNRSVNVTFFRVMVARSEVYTVFFIFKLFDVPYLAQKLFDFQKMGHFSLLHQMCLLVIAFVIWSVLYFDMKIESQERDTLSL